MQKQTILTKLKTFSKNVKQNLFVLYLSSKDKKVPWYAKVVVISVVAYAFSPIDLIPDFIPVLGYLDDLILIPIGILLALKLIPPVVIEEHRAHAEEIKKNGKPKNWFVGFLFIFIWILFAIWIGQLIFRFIL